MSEEAPIRGRFISFEGGEGAGKTTQIARLSSFLISKGKEVTVTREPGGTPFAEAVRRIALNPDTRPSSPLSEAVVMFAARCDHIANVIDPALRRGEWVLTDRFTDSTRAYQGVLQGLGVEKVDALEALCLDGLTPDLTLMLDIEPEAGVQRVHLRGGETSYYDDMDLSQHHAVREAFKIIAHHASKRCMIIDASASQEDVAVQVQEIVDERFGPF